jgi:subtilisin family serine protease
MSPPRTLVALAALAAVSAPAGAAAGGPQAAPAPSTAAPAVLAPSLAARLAHADGSVPVLVTLRDQVEDGRQAGPGDLIRSLRRTAARSQPELLARLPRPARRMWLVNALALRARPAEIRRLAHDPAVARIDYDRRVRLFGPEDAAGPQRRPGPFGRGDWGLAAIGAPAVWRDYGLDGSGVRVGSIDTGVDADHPDLATKVVAWRDFAHGRPMPYDDNGHGTHTIGTMVGGAGGGAPIGVAPGARVVVAKALDRYGDATLSTLMAAAEWMADPDGDPSTADFPTVVNASWGAPSGAGEALRPIIARWRELGIVPVFAAGNTGRSVAAPAIYPESLAVGAVGPRGRVARFSSREPAIAGQAGTVMGVRLAPAARKPDLAGPGVEVVSSMPGGAWASLSGTSMAAPHVSGTIALLREADPTLSASAIESILGRTARELGPAAADGRGGAGAVDARAAVAAVLGARPPRPETSLIAVPPVVTNDAVLTFAVESGGAPLGVWLDGASVPNARTGPFVRLPVGTPGRHTIAFAALNPRGSAMGTRRQVFRVTIDRERPRVALALRRGGLLQVGFRAKAGDGVAGVPEGSLRVRTSESPNLLRGPTARVTFTRAGPYWVEAEAADRAGNVRRVRRVLSWPAGPVGRRLAWNDALVTLRMPFIMARRHRRFDGHYRPRARLARLLAANCEPRVFVAMPTPTSRPPRGAVGVWSDGRTKMLLSTERAGRRYVMEDRDGRLSRGVLSASES